MSKGVYSPLLYVLCVPLRLSCAEAFHKDIDMNAGAVNTAALSNLLCAWHTHNGMYNVKKKEEGINIGILPPTPCSECDSVEVILKEIITPVVFGYRVECSGCDHKGPLCQDEASAIIFWDDPERLAKVLKYNKGQ